MKKILFNGAMLLIFLFLFFACKKNNVSPQNNCNIITLTPSGSFGSTSLNFTYDNSGRISQITEGTSTFIFTYTSNAFQYQEFNGDPSNPSNLRQSFSGTTDNSGLIQSGTEKFYDNNGNEIMSSRTTINYTYDGQGELIKKVWQTGANMPETNTFTWQNGNPISMDFGGGVTATLEYYTDKPSMKGDYLWTIGLVPGINSGLGQFRSKNLLKDITQGNSITDINYTFDSQGKISQIAITGSSNGSYSYQWQCR